MFDAFSLQSRIPFHGVTFLILPLCVLIDRSKIETFCNGMVRWRLKAKQKSNSKNLQKRRQNFQPQTTCKLCWWHAFRKKMIVSKAKKPHLKKVSVKSYNAHFIVLAYLFGCTRRHTSFHCFKDWLEFRTRQSTCESDIILGIYFIVI